MFARLSQTGMLTLAIDEDVAMVAGAQGVVVKRPVGRLSRGSNHTPQPGALPDAKTESSAIFTALLLSIMLTVIPVTGSEPEPKIW